MKEISQLLVHTLEEMRTKERDGWRESEGVRENKRESE